MISNVLECWGTTEKSAHDAPFNDAPCPYQRNSPASQPLIRACAVSWLGAFVVTPLCFRENDNQVVPRT